MQHPDYIRKSDGSTGTSYLSRRIARDKPEILKRMKKGECPSQPRRGADALGRSVVFYRPRPGHDCSTEPGVCGRWKKRARDPKKFENPAKVVIEFCR
jgi:hypothetical protein